MPRTAVEYTGGAEETFESTVCRMNGEPPGKLQRVQVARAASPLKIHEGRAVDVVATAVREGMTSRRMM